LKAEYVRGIAKVIIFDANHSLTIALMTLLQIKHVVSLWIDQFNQLKTQTWIKYIQIFENKGFINGCSNPHPHGQIWATDNIPNLPERKIQNMRNYYIENKRSLLGD